MSATVLGSSSVPTSHAAPAVGDRRDSSTPVEAYLLGLGLVVCLGVVVNYDLMPQEQFYYAKELALVGFAAAAALCGGWRVRSFSVTRLDLVLGVLWVWSAIGSLGAGNRWWAFRALGILTAALVVLRTARGLADTGYRARLTGAIALATGFVALVAVLQAYGFVPDWSGFGPHRAPGATLGSRNPMAHVLVLGLPVLVLHAVTTRRRVTFAAATAGVTLLMMALLLSRTRAAWLATLVVAMSVIIAVARWGTLRRALLSRRTALLAGAALLGIVAARELPNRLVWRSPNPYHDSVTGVVNYQSGSGRGRLLEWATTLQMIRDRPITGVGPGNWAVRYPAFAVPGDLIISPLGRFPVWRFPHGDWLGVAAELGVPGLVLLLVAGALLLRGVWRAMGQPDDTEHALAAPALQSSLVGLAVIGVFDPVMLTPAGAFIVAMIVGALAPRELPSREIQLGVAGRWLFAGLVLLVTLPFVSTSALQLGGSLLYRTHAGEHQLVAATRLYPGDYLGQLLLAQRWVDAGLCDHAAPRIDATQALYPTAAAPRRLRAACLERQPPVNEAALPQAPELINTKVVFAPSCRRVLYSSNRDDQFAPYVLDFSGARPTVSPIPVPRDLDLLVRSLSPDCRRVALLGDRRGHERYGVYLYDFTGNSLTKLADSHTREGDPKFAPRGALLAYLSEGQLRLYDADAGAPMAVAQSPTEFTALEWSSDARQLLLEDRDGSIWQYALAGDTFAKVWRAAAPSSSPRMMQLFDHFLYFVSDHETEVTQIYELDLDSRRLRRVAPSPYPQYSPRKRSVSELIFRTNIDGNLVAMRLRDGQVSAISPAHGVVYDLSLDFQDPVLVYAGEQRLTSIYMMARGDTSRVEDLLDHPFAVAQPEPRELRTSDGMVHYIFAADSQPKGWVVWLHGGPHEQVSPRFNPHFDYLCRLGYGVVALNYPGSTGIGKSYELRAVPDSEQVARQLAGIDEALAKVPTLYPTFRRYALVGVSYGAALAFLHLRRHPGVVTKFVDFSGAATEATVPRAAESHGFYPPILLIKGAEDAQQYSAARLAVLADLEGAATTRRLVLLGEGHHIGHMRSLRIILGAMEQFLAEPPS